MAERDAEPRFVEARVPPALPRDGRGTAVTVGTFDGLHRGHRAVLDLTLERARAEDRRPVLVTFDPHPLKVVRPDRAPPLLTTPEEKKELLAGTGFEYAIFLGFTEELSRYSPERFVREVLVDRLAVGDLVVGHDHGFGRGRSGDRETLRALGESLGFGVRVVDPVELDGVAVSSSRIREAIKAGRLDEARRCLGRPYSFQGRVVRGDGRGAALGFPTANLAVDREGEKLLPPEGVYAAWGVLAGRAVPGALHVGPRPTFHGAPPAVEIHLMDFQGDLYGEWMRVDLVHRIRGVEAFDTEGELVDRMTRDVEEAKRALEEDEREGHGVVRLLRRS